MTILFYCVCKSVKCDLTCSHCKTLHTRGKTERRNSCTEGQRCCVPPNATETGLLICSFFSVFVFISNISHAYKQSKWYTRGEIQEHVKKKRRWKTKRQRNKHKEMKQKNVKLETCDKKWAKNEIRV